MSIWIDRKYILFLSPKLEHFKQKNSNLFTFRCCFCGDSQKQTFKTRGFVYEKDNQYFFRCHNCDKGTTLRNLIQFIDPSLAKEYVLENFKENSTISPTKIIHKPYVPKNKIKIESKLKLPTISSLSNDHIAKKYIIDRQIPKFAWDLLYFAEDFRLFVESVSDTKLDQTGPRIIIPFFSKSGELIAFQGRALDSHSMRYVTIKVDKDHEKIFGLDRIDEKKRILVVEGPFDSMFLPNAIATADSNLASAALLFNKSNLVLVPDNEPRNLNIVNNIEKYVKNGFSVCLLPSYIKEKDVNDMVLSGLTKDEVCAIINDHTYSGLRANIEFIKWRKV